MTRGMWWAVIIILVLILLALLGVFDLNLGR